jgi:hypothetical protein
MDQTGSGDLTKGGYQRKNMETMKHSEVINEVRQ